MILYQNNFSFGPIRNLSSIHEFSTFNGPISQNKSEYFPFVSCLTTLDISYTLLNYFIKVDNASHKNLTSEIQELIYGS